MRPDVLHRCGGLGVGAGRSDHAAQEQLSGAGQVHTPPLQPYMDEWSLAWVLDGVRSSQGG